MFKWFWTIFSLGAFKRSAYLYGSWFPLVSRFRIQVHSIQIYPYWYAKHNGYEAYACTACTPETDDCSWAQTIYMREPLSVSAANLKYLLIKLRQIYNRRGKTYARKHGKSVDKCLKTWTNSHNLISAKYIVDHRTRNLFKCKTLEAVDFSKQRNLPFWFG